MKRGVNEVKDTVKDTVKDLGRGVGESVIEVADAVKVRGVASRTSFALRNLVLRFFFLFFPLERD